ncbi:glycosyltransferase [Alkalihalobacillus sp. LMS39]|uniref:glycosyltransferase n=1 Tax=Alkalihalobacillus sp. LMS39 TaxID=2924032 RepID=UPI001FB26E5F|nr:glycosyltransferase [Alkalihalobacillus sp. LMS39]UOE95441.1 glycosyltransferase [Alkalihalobacillus sp. LMS39]
MKDILIASYDMEIGGVERSLISLLENFDYERYKVDLFLHRHQGDFFPLLPQQVNLLEERKPYTTFRKSISETVKDGYIGIGCSRVLSKIHAELDGKRKKIKEPGYIQMQLMWQYTLPFLPKVKKEYDVAISYLWPHDFVAEKVAAKKKIAWIHTDYSTITTNVKRDIKMWSRFDYIIAVSDACKDAFLQKYPMLEKKVSVMENLTSPLFIKKMADKDVPFPMDSDPRFKIVTVARLSHAKGIDNAILAMKKLKEKGYNDIAWYVVGYGGDEAMLRKMIQENGVEDCFILLGKKVNPYPYMKAADLYVQPSRYEGKAVTVDEAKILGKAILIGNYRTANSQINNMVDGLITEQSIKGLVEGISLLISEKLLIKRFSNKCLELEHNTSKQIASLYQLVDR